jgi:protein TonB
MMLAGKIHFTQPREADRCDGPPMTAAASVRWPAAGHARRPALAAIGSGVLLHITAVVVALAFVQVRPPASPPDDQAVTLVFEPPQAPSAVVPEPTPPPAEAAAEQPAPSEPATPPPELAPPAVEPPASPPEEKSVAAPQPKALPPVVQKPVVRAKPAAPARFAAPPPSATAEAPRAPALPPSAAEPPIAPDWERSLAAWMAAHKVYPELARRRGVEGSVALRFTADRSGRVLNVSLLRSAGSPLLDSAAEAMVRDAMLPPFPAAMPQAVATVNVTVRYALAK